MNDIISWHTPTPPGTASSPDRSTVASAPTTGALETLQSRFALRVTARLTENADALGADLGERLRFAREQALARARSVRTAEVVTHLGTSSSGAALLGQSPLGQSPFGQSPFGRAGRGRGWWIKLASVLPVFALVGGLVAIQQWQDSTQISTAAEIDAALLADDLPPTAYSDAGFAEFLKTPGE